MKFIFLQYLDDKHLIFEMYFLNRHKGPGRSTKISRRAC